MMIEQIKTDQETPRRAVAYCRVSTTEQSEDGYSLAMQEERIRDYCRALGMELVEVVHDAGYSAKNLKRPGIQRVLAMVEAGELDALVIHKLDRLSRSVVDFGTTLKDLDDRGVALVSVTDTLDTASAGGNLVVNIMVAVSQWEREVIGERTKAALAQAKASGTRLGRPPLGWVGNPKGKGLIVDEKWMPVVERIHAMRDSGTSLQAIADRLNGDGVPSPGSSRKVSGAAAQNTDAPKWHRTTIARALRSPLRPPEPIAIDDSPLPEQPENDGPDAAEQQQAKGE